MNLAQNIKKPQECGIIKTGNYVGAVVWNKDFGSNPKHFAGH
jgi:hypothetical protein